jgi:hypothetical protein
MAKGKRMKLKKINGLQIITEKTRLSKTVLLLLRWQT